MTLIDKILNLVAKAEGCTSVGLLWSDLGGNRGPKLHTVTRAVDKLILRGRLQRSQLDSWALELTGDERRDRAINARVRSRR